MGWPDECRQTAWFASAQKLMFQLPLHNKHCCGESRLSKPLPNSPALFDNAEGFLLHRVLFLWPLLKDTARSDVNNSMVFKVKTKSIGICFSPIVYLTFKCVSPLIQHTVASWWFQIFFIFTPIWGRFPI